MTPACSPAQLAPAGIAVHGRPLASRLELAALPGAVPCARLHARLILLEWGLAQLAADCELIVSELVTNAIQAAVAITGPAGPPPVRLSITARPGRVQIEVWDASDDLPEAPARPSHDAPGGRGLLIVAELATRHGSYRTEGGGKCVYALIDRGSIPQERR